MGRGHRSMLGRARAHSSQVVRAGRLAVRAAQRELREQAEGTHGEEREGGKSPVSILGRVGLVLLVGVVLLWVLIPDGDDKPTAPAATPEESLPPEPTVRATPAARPAGTYTVRAGDLCWRIAEEHGVTMQALREANPRIDADCGNLGSGWELVIPGDGAAVPLSTPPAARPAGTYTVRAGDVCWRIAEEHGVTMKALREANPRIDADCGNLGVGWELVIPGDGAAVPLSTPPAARPAWTYAVRAGDLCWRIAEEHGVTTQALWEANPRIDADCGNLGAGWELVIPGDGAAGAEASPHTAPSVTYSLNAGYTLIDEGVVERAIATMATWYETRYGLLPKLPTLIRFEPECPGPWGLGDYSGTAELTESEDGTALVDVCVRLDENSNAAVRSDEARWVLAHEYFHALQANAGWADQPGADCGEQLTEGSAEYFGQMYAFGKIDRVGVLDALAGFFEPSRFLAYEVGVEAFDALVKWKGEGKATRFWESDLERCADAFLMAFGVSPGKYEEDWRELTDG